MLEVPLEVSADARGYVGDRLDDVRFRACDLPIRSLSLTVDQPVGARLFIVRGMMLVADRDPPHEIRDVRFERMWEISTPREDMRVYALRCVRLSIAEVLAHEVDECLIQGGTRVFETHAWDIKITQQAGVIIDGHQRARAAAELDES